jgi:hypothetical protein
MKQALGSFTMPPEGHKRKSRIIVDLALEQLCSSLQSHLVEANDQENQMDEG